MPPDEQHESTQKVQPAMNAIKSIEQTRNRDNQRRLRERRKDYTAELERKLRALERNGVHATDVMQKAARVVLEENKALRQLLSCHGVPSHAIDDFIKTSSTAIELKPPGATRVPYTSAQPSPLPLLQTVASLRSRCHDTEVSRQTLLVPTAPREVSIGGHAQSAESIAPSSRSDAERRMKDNLTSTSPSWPCDLAYADNITISPGVTAGSTSPAPIEPRTRTGTDDVDCEEAACIITSLRGGYDPQGVWPELGCTRAHRTRVRISHVMSLAE